MADSDKNHKIFSDGPTKALFGFVGALSALLVGLSVKTYLKLPSIAPAATARSEEGSPRPRTTPTPAPKNALRLFPANEIRPRHWRVEQEDSESLRMVAPSGAIFEQKLLPLSEGLSPRAIAERIDQRLSRWGQEYQQIRLGSVERGGLKMTRLEYELNLVGKPTQRNVTIMGRVRVGGERRVALWTLAATDQSFSDDKEALEEVGIKL